MHEHLKAIGRLAFATGLAGATAATATTNVRIGRARDADDPHVDPKGLSPAKSEMTLDLKRTALVVIDPHADFLRSRSAAWPVPGGSTTGHKTVQNLARLLTASKHARITVAISLTAEGFRGSGFIPELKPYIEGNTTTIICSPHKRYSPLPRINDSGLQLRRQRVRQIILAGLIANLRLESHLRDFLEQGFEVAVVRDAIAGPKLPEGDGYLSALINSAASRTPFGRPNRQSRRSDGPDTSRG